MGKEVKYNLTIIFDRKEGSPFGGISAQSVSIMTDKDTRDKVLEQFHGGEGVLSVSLNNGITRHINSKNILYIDEVEISEEEGKDEQK